MKNLFPYIALLLLILLPATALAQPAGNSTPRQSTFRIGYIRQDPESVTTAGVFSRLNEFLTSQDPIRAAMAANGIERIEHLSYDTHRLLIEAMDANQLDMAFCTALDYAYQRGNYEPVFQVRKPGDPHSSSGNRRVWHSGVIFVSNRSPLFSMQTTAAVAALPGYVMENGIAMIGSSSAAGYVYPYLALDRLTTSVPVMQAPSDFRDSSSEVIKSVINGIYDIGACDATAIDEVLAAHGLLQHKDKLIKEILRTDPVPRDPIVLNERWLNQPAYSGSHAPALGREIVRGVGGFFRGTPGLPSLDRTSREPFVEVAENLERFRAKKQETEFRGY